MNELEKRHRAAEAERLLNEPLLKEAFNALERQAIEMLLAAKPLADDERRVFAIQANAIRALRRMLEMTIRDGVQAATQTWRPS